MQLRVVTWTRSAATVDDGLGELIGMLRRHAGDAVFVQQVPRSWPRSVARALAAEYRQTPPEDRRPRLPARLRPRRGAVADAVGVIARQDRIIDARAEPLPLVAVHLAVGPWLASADAAGVEPNASWPMRGAARAVLEWADGAAVVLAVAAPGSPPRVDGLRHVAAHPGGHIFVGGPAQVIAVRVAPAGAGSAIIADLRLAPG